MLPESRKDNLGRTFYASADAYPTVEEFGAKVEEYFSWCFAKKFDQELGRDIEIVMHPPTITGLARYLGFRSRKAMLEYKNANVPAYEEVLDDAKMRIEEYLETRLYEGKNIQGIPFGLKNNFSWNDKAQVQISGEDDKALVFGWSANARDVIDVGREYEVLTSGEQKALAEGGDGDG